jgi:hypothetical protein
MKNNLTAVFFIQRYGGREAILVTFANGAIQACDRPLVARSFSRPGGDPRMRCVAGVLFVFLIFSLAPVAAQSPQYRHGGPPPPAQEECPQGRQIRAQRAYPSTMTDCEVLDADTAAENQKLNNRRAAPVVQPAAKQVTAAPQPAPPEVPIGAAPPAIQRMIDREMALNDTCRGSTSGYEQACKDRDALVTQLRDFGWCYGTPEQFGYQKQWQLCSAPPPKVAEPARPQSPAQQPATPASPSIALVAPLEPDAVIFDNIKGNNDILNAMVNLVRLNDFRCDTISSAKAWLMSKGFTLKCNRFSYSYEIADKGGHWIVTVE